MSLTTRCPSCQTLFRVVPDQLRISGGWVRCGQCDEIFDASAQLLPTPLEATPERPAALSDVSFLHVQASDSSGRTPLLRSILILLSLALMLGLLGQITFHERDRLTASAPSLKPWLLKFCGVLGCTLLPLQKIESIMIDSSSFIKLQEDAYRLNFTLKNTASTALAQPAIELTLTDSLDQPLVRRVFLDTELGVQSKVLAAGNERPVSLAVTVTSAVLPRPVAGYRLLAFYP